MASSDLSSDSNPEFEIRRHLSTRIRDKREDFNFEIINFPHLSSNITTSSAYDISQLLLYPKCVTATQTS